MANPHRSTRLPRFLVILRDVKPPRMVALPILVALLAGACGDSADDASPTTTVGTASTAAGAASTAPSTDSSSPGGSTTSVRPGPASTTATTGSVTPTTPAPGSTATTGGGTTTLPGEPIDLGWPRALDRLGVIGVAHDDVLYVLRAPGEDQPEVATLAPLATNVVATGRKRALPNSIWFELSGDAFTGWASARFLAYIGQTTDQTAAIVGVLGRPTEPDMAALGLRVARSRASIEPESRVVMSAAPRVGDLGEVTYDVVGLGDDALSGYRLTVFGSAVPGGFELRNVEATVLCTRGLTPERICT